TAGKSENWASRRTAAVGAVFSATIFSAAVFAATRGCSSGSRRARITVRIAEVTFCSIEAIVKLFRHLVADISSRTFFVWGEGCLRASGRSGHFVVQRRWPVMSAAKQRRQR